jgi:signal transduction histidine kinase
MVRGFGATSAAAGRNNAGWRWILLSENVDMVLTSTPPGSVDKPRAQGKADILLVDDHPNNLLALEAVLQDLGHNIVKATSGDEALRRLLAGDFAVILLDVQMQDLDGFETAKLIRGREKSRQTPIIFLTAFENNRLSTEEAYQLGAVDYLVKPIVPVILKAKVAGFIELFQKTEQVKQQAEQLRQMERREFTQKLAEENARLRLTQESLRESEQRYRQLAEKLKEEAQRKDEFLAMLAHELRNPLAPVRNALQIIKMPEASAQDVSKAREMMERQLQHLVRLVDDLLDVSRIMRNRIELRKERVDLTTVFARAVETAQPVMDAQGHRLNVSLPAEPIAVEGDVMRLAQVVGNLLVNAAKYTDKAGYIWLTGQREDQEAVIRVRDTGIGIDAKLLPEIFDLFVQSDRSLARSQGGLGIGLTLVKRLVELHGGSVTAHSPGLGQGSEFVVRLAALAGDRVTMVAKLGCRGHESDEIRRAPAPRRVLVVDDNVDAASSAAMLLRFLGHEVQTAHDGAAALAAATSFVPDVALLDIGLPGMSGYELARALRARPEFRTLTLVALTGYGNEEDRRKSIEAGFNRHLVKPVDPAAVAGLLAEC